MPERKNVILIRKNDQEEVYGSLKDACDNRPEFIYNYIRRKKYPFTYKGFEFSRIKFRKKLIE